MDSLFTHSADGTRIAYNRVGAGPAIIMLHGGGGSRGDWHEAGYVKRLQDDFMVVTLDLRGHGESGLPTESGEYTIEKFGQDILAVANACGIERFNLWGMSFGGKVGRYLAVESERVAKLILIGTPLGPGVSGERRQEAIDFCAHWHPIIQALGQGSLALESLSPDDRDFLRNFNVSVMLGWVRAMLDWPAILPADFRCPTLWLIGSEDRHAIASYKEHKDLLQGSKLQSHIVEGFDHQQVFSEIARVFPIMLAFIQS